MCPASEESMRRIRSLKLLQKPPNCVAQLSGAVCVVPTAVREDDALGLPRQHRLDSRLQFTPVPPRKIQPQITRHAPVRRGDATHPLQHNSTQGVASPGSGFASRSVRTAVRLEAQRRLRENVCAGAWYQGRSIAETAAKLQG